MRHPRSVTRLPFSLFYLMLQRPPSSTLFPYTTLFRSKPPMRIAGEQSAIFCNPDSELAEGGGSLFSIRSEEHTPELQSHGHRVYRLLHEKNNYLRRRTAFHRVPLSVHLVCQYQTPKHG